MARLLLLPVLLLTACGGDALTRQPESGQIFDQRALALYPREDRAYVIGHAFGVYLYSQTLPSWIAPSGYTYEPGKSSRFARIGYDYSGLVTDDAPPAEIEPGSECTFTNIDNYVCPDGESPRPDEDDDGDPQGDGEPVDPPYLDEDCESFLDPAALHARRLRMQYDVDAVMAEGFDAEELAAHRDRFELGFSDSLALEDLDEETDYSEAYAMQEYAQEAGMCEHSPLVFDLFGDGISASAPENGVVFDLRQTGLPVLTAWPRGDDALLVMDRDGDGAITNGGELFGNALATEGNRHNNGFEMLAHLDRGDRGGNDDGVIDQEDAAFTKLMLWQDDNRDGVSAPSELTKLKDARVTSISLESRLTSARDAQGNKLALWGSFNMQDRAGKARELPVVDIWFRIKSVATLSSRMLAKVR